MQDIKNKIEGVLFITGRFMDLEEIAKLCSIGSVGMIKEAIKELIEDYKKRECGLEIHENEGKFKLGLKKEYIYLSASLGSNCDMDAPTQATLAVIAYKQPALQAEVIKMRGNKAYDHIHALKEMQFIFSEKKGRTRLLKLAPKFFDYFDVIENEMKEKFNQIGEKYAQQLKEAGVEEKQEELVEKEE